MLEISLGSVQLFQRNYRRPPKNVLTSTAVTVALVKSVEVPLPVQPNCVLQLRSNPFSVKLRARVNISVRIFFAQINRSSINYLIFVRQTSTFAKVANRRYLLFFFCRV